jgi:hypothetical protein
MMAAGAPTDRERWVVVGGGLLATLVVIGVAAPPADAAGVAFPYPPHARLLMLPFGAMPYSAAAALWSALNLFCIYRAAELIHPRRDLALFAALSPAALTTLAFGYAGGFLALMAAVIMVQGAERPIRAGLCLALMTVQPQLAFLFGMMLLVLGYRRAAVMAVPWTLALVAASVITFGPEPWIAFLHAGAPQTAAPLSLEAAAGMAGLPAWVAQVLQWSFGFAVLAGAALVFLRRGPDPRSIALLLLAIVLALPGANSDVFVVAGPALAVALFAESQNDERPFLPFVPALLIWSMPLLAVSFSALAWPVAAPLAAGILTYALVQRRMAPMRALAGQWRAS